MYLILPQNIVYFLVFGNFGKSFLWFYFNSIIRWSIVKSGDFIARNRLYQMNYSKFSWKKLAIRVCFSFYKSWKISSDIIRGINFSRKIFPLLQLFFRGKKFKIWKKIGVGTSIHALSPSWLPFPFPLHSSML